jgi:hypothetical protein
MVLRRRNYVGVLLFFAALVAAALFFAPEKTSEPTYKGQPLSYWLDDTHDPQGPTFGERQKAVLAIGTNAIPFLLEMIAAHEPPTWLRRIEDRIRSQPRPWSDDLNSKGVEGFRIFQTNAVSAVPALIEICERDYSRSSTRSAINALAEIGHGAQPAVPTLVRDFNHKDWMVQLDALAAIMKIGGKPDLVIPAAAKALNDTNKNVRWNAIGALSAYGAQARRVAPEILKLRDDAGMVGRYRFSKIVDQALWPIAPETVGKPLEIEMPPSFVKEGITTQSIKVDLVGERKVLLRKGAKEPAVARYWNSDPRGPRADIALFVGDESSNDNDVLIGKFEVVGDLGKKDANIHTALVVVNGKTLLMARDVDNEMFLEVRKLETDGK